MGRYTERLRRTAKLRHELDEARVAAECPRDEPCHDCAFGPGSPEREDPEQWATLLRQSDPANGIQPFYCHFTHDGEEMPVDADGNYVPERYPDGRPKGYPMCAGWAKVFDVKVERLRKEPAT